MAKSLGIVTKDEREVLDRLNSCKRACEQIVRTVIDEYEKSADALGHFWKAIGRKYIGDAITADELSRLSIDTMTDELTLDDYDEYLEKRNGQRKSKYDWIDRKVNGVVDGDS